MVRAETVILNKLGLHARASAKLTQLASSFDSDVWMEKGARRINAKSIMGVMMLAAAQGARITLHIQGEDEVPACAALESLIADRFGEGE